MKDFISIRSKETNQIAMITGSKPNRWRKYEQCDVKLADISGRKRGNA
jgi:hypothetical protein